MENDHDKMILSKIGAFNNLLIFPTPVPDEELIDSKKRIQEVDLNKHYRGHLAFDGDFQEESDIDNLELVLKELWPSISEHYPEMKLDIMGNNMNKKVLDMCSSSKNVRPVVISFN